MAYQAQPQLPGSLALRNQLLFGFFSVTRRSLSAWFISSCHSCIPKAWGGQEDISTLLKRDIIHFAATVPFAVASVSFFDRRVPMVRSARKVESAACLQRRLYYSRVVE
jgi:hypothetical protein